MKSIYLRIFMFVMCIILVSFFIFTIVFVPLSYNFARKDKMDALSVTSSVIAYTTSAKLAEVTLDSWDLRMMISTIARSSNSQVSICGQDGVVVSCSDEDMVCEHMGKSLSEDIIAEVEEHGQYEGMTNLNGFYNTKRYVSVTAVDGPYNNTRAGYIVVSIDAEAMTEIWKPMFFIFTVTGLSVIVIAFSASYFLTGKEVAPMREMAEAAKKFADGDFSVRVQEARRKDEIGELAAAFNAMASSLEKSEMQRREFIANVSHELKTPMTTISGFADGILDGTIPPERQKRYLEIITNETKRLSRLVKKMLDISRIQAMDTKRLTKSQFNVTELAAKALISLEGHINEKKLSVETRFPEEPVVVVADEDAIMQVVYNLIDNAVKFARQEGTLSIAIWKKENKAYISVKDQGAVIAPEELPLVFDRFYKTDSSRSEDVSGVGLGLYIVKAIIKNHGEDIFARSENGETEFVFTLPLKQGK